MLDLHPHRGAELGVEVRERLVHQEDWGSRTTARASAHRALTLAAESAPGLRFNRWPSSTIGGAADQGVPLVLRDPAHAQGKADILVDRHVGVERVARNTMATSRSRASTPETASPR